MRKLLFCCALALAVLIPMASIRSGDTNTKPNTRDPTPVEKIEQPKPIIVHPDERIVSPPHSLVPAEEEEDFGTTPAKRILPSTVEWHDGS